MTATLITFIKGYGSDFHRSEPQSPRENQMAKLFYSIR